MERIEEKIRDKLALRLHILDEGLTLLKKEAFLPNDKGTKGFVDLLAKDFLNRYLLIELKRSKAASREAIHEILKYIEGIKENKSLKNDEIVAFIVSTEWDELLIPFSSFVQDAPYSVLGYKLIVDDNLNPISAKRVNPIILKNERFLSDQHSIALYTKKSNLNKGIESHVDSFSRKNIQDYVLLILNAHPNLYEYSVQSTLRALTDIEQSFGTKPSCTYEQLKERMPEYKYMIYSSVQVMDIEKYWEILKTNNYLYEEIKENSDICSQEELHRHAIDDCQPTPFKELYDIGYPSKLAYKLLEDEAWEIDRLIRGGKLQENELLTDEMIIGELKGNSGANKQKYYKKFFSKNNSSLNQISNDIKKCLVNNEIWLSGLNKALLDITELSKNFTFQGEVHIYNPSNTLLSIYHTIAFHDPNDEMRWIPKYDLYINGDGIQKSYFGCLIYIENFVDLQHVIKNAYDGNVSELIMSRIWGGYQSNDIDISSIYGLEYSNFMIDLSMSNSEPLFYKFDGYRYKPHPAIKPKDGIFHFLNQKGAFVREVVDLFEGHSLTPGVIQF